MARWGKTAEQKAAIKQGVAIDDAQLRQEILQRGATATIAPNAVTNTKLSDMAQATIKGRATGAGTGDPQDLTATQLVAIIATADGAGSGLDADLLDGNSSAAFQPVDADLTSWAGVTRASGFDTFAATPSSANLRSLLTDESGTGAAYFQGGDIGTPSAGVLTNATGLPTAGLVDDAVTNAKAANMAAWTVKVRNAGTTGDPSDAALADITEEASPAAGDFLFGFLGSGELRKFDVDNLPGGGGGISNVVEDVTPQLGGDLDLNGNRIWNLIFPPQGRLTVASGTPIVAVTDSGNATMYYTPFGGRLAPLYDGTRFSMHDFGSELSQATTDTTKSPAAVANDSNYDMFLWLDSGTYRCTRGPAWSNSTTRGTGAGTTELEYLNGFWVNKVSITNGPGAQRGLWVGTIRSNGSAQIDWTFGGSASGGTAARFCVWNNFNRIDVTTLVQESAASWTYNSATPRAVNSSSNMRVSFVTGSAEDPFKAEYSVIASGGTSSDTGIPGIGLDSTSVISGVPGYAARGQVDAALARYSSIVNGFHFIQALEACNQAATVTFYGSGSGAIFANGLTVTLRM